MSTRTRHFVSKKNLKRELVFDLKKFFYAKYFFVINKFFLANFRLKQRN